MSPLEYSRKRLRAFLNEVQHLKQAEFPYPYSADALADIQARFHQHLGSLNTLSDKSHAQTVQAACRSALSALFEYLPLVGFVLRSTDVRNAFEIYGPVLRLARAALGDSTKLVLSAEWDYSPVTYCGMPLLPQFTLIGLPAPESANPLLVPLAGHELGHAVWLAHGYSTALASDMDDAILAEIDRRWDEYHGFHPAVDKADLNTDLFARQSWEPAQVWGLLQAEEGFCDFVGLRIFGVGYLHAFAYLLSPSQEGRRSPFYPPLKARVADLLTAAERWAVSSPDDYQSLFEDSPGSTDLDPHTTFLLSLADSASGSLVARLIDEAKQVIDDAGIESPDLQRAHDIYEGFKQYAVPPRDPGSLADIVNAGWEAFHDKELWANHPEIQDSDRTLKELILKSIEVLDIDQVLKSEAQ